MTETVTTLRNSTPFDLVKSDIDDLYEEAKTWLDGSKVETQEQADTIAKLLDLARKARKEADKARVDEKKPHDQAAKAVQERFKPLLSKADLIAETCKKAVAPFLAAQEQEKRAAEQKAREEAEAADRVAQEAMHQTGVGDIELREQAEKLVEDAKQAQVNVAKLSKDKGQAKGGARAVSLRATYSAELTDLNVAVQYYWKERRADFEALISQLAKEDVRAGKRDIPGFEIKEQKVAV